MEVSIEMLHMTYVPKGVKIYGKMTGGWEEGGIEGMGRWDDNEKERTAHETHTLHTCTQKYWLSVCKHNVLQLYIQLVSVNKLRANICINVNALLTLEILCVYILPYCFE